MATTVANVRRAAGSSRWGSPSARRGQRLQVRKARPSSIYNDLLAVRICPQVLRLADGPDQYSRAGNGNRIDPNVDFAESPADGEVVAPHHNDKAGEGQVASGHVWDLLAIGSALRDRYYVRALASFADE